MKKVLIVVFALCFLLTLSVAGCNAGAPGSPSPGTPGSQAPSLSPANSATAGKGEVYVYNWGGPYMDVGIFKDFEKQTGIKVNYSEFQTNEEMYSILKSGGALYDVIIPSDYMISRLISEGMLEELDFSNIPNYNFIDENYKNLEYDPDGKYSVAYMVGTICLIYNSAMIEEDITSWSALFDSNYSGQILMFDNPRDAVGITLKYLGYSPNTVNEDEIREAFALLSEQKPLLQAYVMDQIFDKLESGEAAIGPYYAGDFLEMRENNEDLVFVRPEEGSNVFVDAMCIPKGAKNKTNAELFINFMCSTDAGIANMAITRYASANYEAAEKFSAGMDPEDREIVFASDETLANCEVFTNLPDDILALYTSLWVELKR